MRIALFHNLPSGGAKRVTYEQVRELARRGHTVHEFTQSTADLSFMPLCEYVASSQVYSLSWQQLRPCAVPGLGPYIHLLQNSRNLSRLNSQSKCIAADINKGHFDLAFVADCILTTSPFILRNLKIPSVFYIHSMPERLQSVGKTRPRRSSPARFLTRVLGVVPRFHKRMIWQIGRANLGYATRVLTNSYFMRELRLFSDGIQSHVVYPAVDTETFRPRRLIERSGFVLSVGTLDPSKGHWFVIRALGLLPKTIRPKLVIASVQRDKGQEIRIRESAAEHSVSVELCNVHDSDDLAQLYSDALILASAPVLEPLGLAALEAMACGTPVVAVKEGGLRETVKDNVTGFLVERDAAQFAIALRRLIQDDELRTRFGGQARQYIDGSWTWARVGDDLEAQFAAVLDGKMNDVR